MFVSGEVLLDVGLDVARTWLASQVRSGGLLTASQDAYAAGFAALPGDGLPGSGLAGSGLAGSGLAVSGLAVSRLAEVKVREPVRHGDSAVTALRWEAIGPRGELFPVLDANLTLVPAGEECTTLRLTAAYRPPPDSAGARFDRLALDRVAAATVQEFLSQVSAAITSAAPATGHQRPDAEAS